MQRNREARDNSRTSGEHFDNFGSMFSSIFGGKNPFFSRPFGSLFGSDKSSTSSRGNPQPTDKPKGPIIEELDSDAEGASEDEVNDVGSAAWMNRNPLIEHPEDQGNDRGKSSCGTGDTSFTTNHNKVEAKMLCFESDMAKKEPIVMKKPQAHSVSFQRVTYGGIDGAYYTATSSRRTGDDGVAFEERKQADRTTGEATHRVSRGIHDKGLSVTRKLDSAGKVDTVKTLQNLNEDELEGFERAWGGIPDDHFHHWNDNFDFPRISGSSSSGRPGPLGEFFGSRGLNREMQERTTGGRPKKVVRINIE